MENILKISSKKDPITLDPQKSGEPISSAMIFLLFKGLTRFESDHKIKCDLASSFHVSNDGKTYTFFLGEHYWSDGHRITAHDFVYSWKRPFVSGFPVRATNFFSYFKNAQKIRQGKASLDKLGVYARDDFTLVVELSIPCPHFLELTSFCPLFPISPRAKQEEIFSICSGPFILEKWKKRREILFKRNSSCATSPHLDGINIKIISDPKKAFALFEKNQLHWIGDPLSPLPVSYLPTLLEVKKIKPIAGFTSCWFNCSSAAFHNVNLRRAFGHVVPREELIEKLLLPSNLQAKRFFPPILSDFNFPSFFHECSKEANALFETALCELKVKRLKLTLGYEATEEFSRLAALLKFYWEKAFKVTIQLCPLSFKELWQVLPDRQLDMTIFRVAAQYTDVINFLERFEFKNAWRNFSKWEKASYQKLLKRYRATADLKKRQELADKAEAVLLNEMPIAPLYYYYVTYLQKENVRNLNVSPIGVMQFDRLILEHQQEMFSDKKIAAFKN